MNKVTGEEETRSPDALKFDEIRQLLLDKRGGMDEIELLRKEAYVELPIQKLLRNLLEDWKKVEIIPTYDPSQGYRYKTVESVFDKNVPPERAEELLERLTRLKILNKKFYDTVSACPACKSPSVTLHYHCPRCSSHNIVKTGLTEHIPCGNIDEKGKYRVEGQTTKCPKCGSILIKGEYRNIGLWYICRECGEKFEHPGIDLICRSCNNHFTIRKALIKEVPKYGLNPEMEQEVRLNVTSLEAIYTILTGLGFVFETSPTAIGQKSGIKHSFSLLAKKSFSEFETVAAVDHAVGDVEVNASSLIFYIYKISEVKVDLPIFVAIPKLSDTAKKIAEGYNVLVVEGTPKEKEQLDQLEKEIQERLKVQKKKPLELDQELLDTEFLSQPGFFERLRRSNKKTKTG